MSELKTTSQTAGEPGVHERCLCREVLDQFRDAFGVSPQVREHFTKSRIEFLKGIRAIIDSRIEHLSASGTQHGTKITVE
jgi:hypothetical protein